MREIIIIIFSVVLLLVSLTFIVLASVALGVDAYNIMSLSYSELLGLLVTFSVLFLASMFLVGIFSYKLKINRNLIFAACNGKLEVVRLLLAREGIDVNEKDQYGYTALIWAAIFGHGNVVGLLLENGADVNAKNNYYDTALILASLNGNLEVVGLLLARECIDVNAKNNYGNTALILAATCGHGNVAQLLLEEDADVNATDNHDRTVLILAAFLGKLGVVRLLLEEGADVNATDNHDYTALICAALGGHLEVEQLLLENGADVNLYDVAGDTALTFAAREGHLEVAQLLLDKGADVNAADNNDYTALLIWAAREGHFEVAQPYTALIWAAREGHLEVAQLLLDKGADVDATDKNDYTALIWAAREGHLEVAQLLLEEDADVNAQNIDDIFKITTSIASIKMKKLICHYRRIVIRNKSGKFDIMYFRKKPYLNTELCIKLPVSMDVLGNVFPYLDSHSISEACISGVLKEAPAQPAEECEASNLVKKTRIPPG